MMKRKTILLPLLVLLTGSMLHAQGIKFEQDLNWGQVLAKAKKEHKYIFVDCYATWCGPCKEMEEKVYPVDSIGKFAADHYISVKAQLDRTKSDNQHIKDWYATAESFTKEFNIGEFPTYLFISPEGKLVHRAIGYQNPDRFFAILKRSLDPEHQYYVLLNKYKNGQLPIEQDSYVAKLAQSIGDESNANDIATNYIKEYLLKQSDDQLYSKKNVLLIRSFPTGSNTEAFKFFYHHQDKIDTAMRNPGFARRVVYETIEREDITPFFAEDKLVSKNGNDVPDWPMINNQITKKYNTQYADFMLLSAKIIWARKSRDWKEFCSNIITRLEKYGAFDPVSPTPDGFYGAGSKYDLLNAAAWTLFLSTSDKGQLETAAKWSKESYNDKVVDRAHYTQYQDTYANILYKMGRVDEAITEEEGAINGFKQSMTGFTQAQIDFHRKFTLQPLETTLAKMKADEPTWPKH